MAHASGRFDPDGLDAGASRTLLVQPNGRRHFGSCGERRSNLPMEAPMKVPNAAADRTDAATLKLGAPMSAPFGRWPFSCKGSC